MADVDPVIVFVLTIGTTIIAIIAANIWNSKSRKDRQMADKFLLEKETERIAIEKKRDDIQLAKELKEHDTQMAVELRTHAEELARAVKTEMREYINQSVKDVSSNFDHKMELYEQREASLFKVLEQNSVSSFKATDLIMKSLMDKIVDTAKNQADAIIKINDTLDYFRKLIDEMTRKVDRVETKQEDQDRD